MAVGMGINGFPPDWPPPPSTPEEPGRRAWISPADLSADPQTEGPEVGWSETSARLAARPRAAPLAGAWSFWADMIVGGQPLGMADLGAFTCTKRLSGAGAATATLMLPSSVLADLGTPDRWAWSWRLWALYEGRPYWAGIPTGWNDEGGASASFTLTELPGYLQKRQWDIHPRRRYTQVEQTTIARDIAQPVGDVGVNIVTRPGPGFPRDREYEYLESESRYRLLENLTNVIEGPEFRSEYAMGAQGRPGCSLVIGYPRVGTDEAGLGLTVPGEALGYGATWDGDHMRTRTFAVGDVPEDAPEGTLKPVAVVERPLSHLPRLDEVDDYPGVILQSTLNERANAEATRQAGPALEVQVTAPEAAPPLLDYNVGDDVTVRVTTLMMPGGLEVPGRLTGLEVNAAEGRVTWTVVISLPAPRARATLMQRLNALDYVTRGTFRKNTAPL